MADLFAQRKPRNLSKLMAEIRETDKKREPKATQTRGYLWTQPQSGYLWDQHPDYKK